MLKNEIKKLLPTRKKDSHKGNYGRVLILGGSPGMTGAVILAGKAALRIGAGLVYLGVPKSLQNFVDLASLETITLGLADTKLGFLDPKAFGQIESLGADVIAIGPGLSLQPGIPTLVQKLLTLKTPLIIDADGLNGLALSGLEILKNKTGPVVLTPHPGEMARLLEISTAKVQKDRNKIAREVAVKYGITVALKGYKTVIAQPNGKTEVNLTGNPGMASAGVGDVLCGMVAGLLGQGLEISKAVKLAVYLHGLAGDMAASALTQYSMIASEVIDFIPEALKKSGIK